jgi:hypothetical protein
MVQKAWQQYEEVARELLNRFRRDFDLDRVEPKQCLPGASGSLWEIDAKGVRVSEELAVIVVECRRRSRRATQEAVGALAFKIQDVGAVGGIIVTPLPLQRGAAAIASHAKIIEVRLDQNSTFEQFGMSFLDKILRQSVESIRIVDSVSAALENSGQ